MSEQTLRHRLRQKGLLASLDEGRGMLLVRRTLERHPRQVVHLKAKDLVSIEMAPRVNGGRANRAGG